jgi:hypothetical protein
MSIKAPPKAGAVGAVRTIGATISLLAKGLGVNLRSVV